MVHIAPGSLVSAEVPMGRLLSFNKPEWPFFIPAILGALIDGSAMPVRPGLWVGESVRG